MKWLFWVRGSPEWECTPMETIIRSFFFFWSYCFVSRSVCEFGSGLKAFIFPHTWRYKGLAQRQNKSSADNFRHKRGLPALACRLRIARRKLFGEKLRTKKTLHYCNDMKKKIILSSSAMNAQMSDFSVIGKWVIWSIRQWLNPTYHFNPALLEFRKSCLTSAKRFSRLEEDQRCPQTSSEGF